MVDQIFRKMAWIAGVLLLVLFVTSQGCAPLNSGPAARWPDSRERIGTLQVMTGQNVFLNRRPASSGMVVYNGDNVSTGENSKARVRFFQGGFVELDQNTDPDFIMKAYCLLVKIFKGQVYAEGSDICIETPESESLLDSAVNIKVLPGLTIATVLKGKLTIRRPKYLVIRGHQQARIRKTTIENVRSLSRQEVERVTEWRRGIGPRGEQLEDTKQEQCRGYARTAIRQNQENLKRGCGFTGPRWTSDFTGHYQWCLKVPEEFAESETRARKEALNTKCHVVQ